MTDRDSREMLAMNDWEAQINALLDGELDDREADTLKNAAERDRELARAIIEAYQLQRLMATLPQERAPDSLRRRLRAIPAEQGGKDRGGWLDWLRRPQWVATAAAIPLVLLLVLAGKGEGPGEPREPSLAEIEQARQELVLALAYLERAGRATERRIDRNIDRRMAVPVTEEMVRAIEQPFDLGDSGPGENHQQDDFERQEREA